MRRRLLRSVLVLAAVLVVALGGALLTIVVRGDPPPPPWVGSRSACRTDAMRHVHDPSRLELRAACATFTGRVTSVRFVPAFNDVKVTFHIDADASKQEIEALVAQSQKRSAVFDALTNPTNVSVEVA